MGANRAGEPVRGAVAGGVAAPAGRFELLADLTIDRIHEPYRSVAYPELPRLTGAAVAGLQLFLSGTRDALAELPLLEPVIEKLRKRATLHLVDTADHSFKILKRTRTSAEDVFTELARVTRDWASRLK